MKKKRPPFRDFSHRERYVNPSAIIDFRLVGKIYLDIFLRFGLGPEICHVSVRETVIVGPPYGKAYGHYKKKPKKQWRTIVLNDNDVVNLVNLRFVSDHYKYEPEKVMKLREGGKNFVAINDEVVKEKKGGKEKGEDRKSEVIKDKSKEKGKGNSGKGKGKK